MPCLGLEYVLKSLEVTAISGCWKSALGLFYHNLNVSAAKVARTPQGIAAKKGHIVSLCHATTRQPLGLLNPVTHSIDDAVMPQLRISASHGIMASQLAI